MNHEPEHGRPDPDLAQHARGRTHSPPSDRPADRAASRRDHWPKDDQRSSSRLTHDADYLTAEEREASWPLG